VGLSSYKTNHNKAPVRVLVSQPITAYVGHIRWHLPVDITCGGSAARGTSNSFKDKSHKMKTSVKKFKV